MSILILATIQLSNMAVVPTIAWPVGTFFLLSQQYLKTSSSVHFRTILSSICFPETFLFSPAPEQQTRDETRRVNTTVHLIYYTIMVIVFVLVQWTDRPF